MHPYKPPLPMTITLRFRTMARTGLVAFLPAFTSFFGTGLVLLPLAALWPLGAPVFWLAPFFEDAVSSATVAPGSATATAFSVVVASAFVMVVSVNPFAPDPAHDDSSLRSLANARQK